jgi:hypothetical protein
MEVPSGDPGGERRQCNFLPREEKAKDALLLIKQRMDALLLIKQRIMLS